MATTPSGRRCARAVTAIDEPRAGGGPARAPRRQRGRLRARCRCRTAPRWSTFQDVTDSVNVERALRERNEALVEADEIKIDFVHHVSYELRSPLTNIIGFAHFLGDPATGPLDRRSSTNISATSPSRPTRCSR